MDNEKIQETLLKFRLNQAKNASTDRLILASVLLTFCFGIIFMDSLELIDVNKWGYSFIGGLIVLVVNFFFRKTAKGEKGDIEVEGMNK